MGGLSEQEVSVKIEMPEFELKLRDKTGLR